MNKQVFISLIKKVKPVYVNCIIYKKLNGIWTLHNYTVLENQTGKLYKGQDTPHDTIGNDNDIYIQTSNLKVEFTSYHPSFGNYDYISANHYGWECPSMYHDTPPEKGNCDILTQWWNPTAQTHQKGLLLQFTTDDYSERCYLSLEVLDENTLMIIRDDKGRQGKVLIRIPDIAIDANF